MELLVRGHDLHISDEIREFAARRIDNVGRILDNVVEAKLELRRTHQRASGSVAAQVTIQTGRNILRAEERDADALRAVDLAIDKIERQARRVHERRSDRHGPRAGELETAFASAAPNEDDDDDTESIAKLVRRKRFTVKPMDPEEAIEQMELLGHDFFLFHNADESQINVVYRRQDGTYGLLSPS